MLNEACYSEAEKSGKPKALIGALRSNGISMNANVITKDFVEKLTKQ